MLYDPWDLWRILNWVMTHGPSGGGFKKTTEDAYPTQLRALLEPSPSPWMTAVSGLVAAAGVLQQADNLPSSASSLSRQLQGSANASIAQVLDDYCGTPPKPPRRMHWP